MNDLSDEVDKFVDGMDPDDQPPPRANKRRKVAREALARVAAPPPPPPKVEEEEEEEDRDDEEEEEEEDEDPAYLLPRTLPKAAETQRTLGSMLSKYRIGEDPEFKLQLHRLLPKYFPGTSTQAHGFIDEYTQPIDEAHIAAEYGGGTYKIVVMGPDPKSPPNGVRQYDSIKVETSGAPNPSRVARSVQAQLDKASGTQSATPHVAPMVMVPPQENPTLATAALKMASEMADRAIADRHRAEDKATSTADATRAMFEPIVEAERRRADDVLKIERERGAIERAALEERLKESRDEVRRLAERVESMSNVPPLSMSDELGKLMAMTKGDGDAAAAARQAAESITKNILERHQAEIEAMHKQHQTMLETMRQSHLSEVALMRESAAKQIDVEREAGRLREQRHEEALKSEREERRKDAELYKRTESDRDKGWRDRLEQQEMNLKIMWESRVETQKSNYESQLQWMRTEIEQLQIRVRGFESQNADRGDIIKQLGTLRDLKSVAKDALGIDDSPAPATGGGGIGLSGLGEGQNWQEVVQTAIENFPAIWGTISGQQAPQQQQAPAQVQVQQQPPAQPGQIVQTPQGTMIVVQTPNGLALAPKDQYDAYQQQEQARASRQVGPGARQRGILGPARAQSKPSAGIPVPNMAEGLPKPRPWGEPVQPPLPTDQPPAQPAQAQAASAPAPQRGRTSKPKQQPGTMDEKTKLMIANEVAKLVHHSVDGGDEPEEFVQKVLSGPYPPIVVQTIAGMGDDEVIASIKKVQPNSAGATPAGQRFVREALKALREAI